MATVYSLICWGGRTGKSVTASNSSGLIFTTSAAHGLRDATALQFTATTLPGNVAANTTYYAKVLSSTTFSVYTESVLTNRVAWSSSGSAVYAKSKKMLDYLASPPSSNRWGPSGSERCYDGVASWNSGRSGASSLDYEVCELGQSFHDVVTSSVYITVPAGASRITSMLNGAYTEAFHNGLLDSGFVIDRALDYPAQPTIWTSLFNFSIDGFTVLRSGGNSYNSDGISLGQKNLASNMIIWNSSGDLGGTGCAAQVFSDVTNCLIIGWNVGVYIKNYTAVSYGNCTVVKNKTGFYAYNSPTNAWVYNCISVGNTVANWGTYSSGGYGFSKNAGLSTDTIWTTSGGSSVSMATSDFVNFAGNNFKPASSSSPQVDSGAAYYGALNYDLSNAERPSYNNGGAEAVDIGCYEYDHGFGNHPASTNVTFLGVVAGSEIHVYDSEDNELVGTESCTANQSLTWGIPTNPNVKITIIKRGLRWMKFTYLSEEGPQTIPIFPQPDLGYNNPA